MNKMTKTAVAIVLASMASLTFAANAYEITSIGTVSNSYGDANYRVGVINYSGNNLYVDATQYGGSALPEATLPPHTMMSVPNNYNQYHFHMTSSSTVVNADLDVVSGSYVGVDNTASSSALMAQIYNM